MPVEFLNGSGPHIKRDIPSNLFDQILRKKTQRDIRQLGEQIYIGEPSPATRRIALKLYEKMHGDRKVTPWRIFFDNLKVAGDKIFVSANKDNYTDMWLRDTMMACEFIDHPELEENILRNFESKQTRSGQIPQAVAIEGSTPWHYADDESTLLYLIWSARLTRKMDFKPNTVTANAALSFIRQHVIDGRFCTTKGERKGWLDALKYKKWDVVTQNQGLYAVALIAAKELGLDIGEEEIATAKHCYKELAKPHGYLPLSARYDEATDASVLYPEYLAKTIFEQELLNKEIVANTLASLPVPLIKEIEASRTQETVMYDFQILSETPSGIYFSPEYFLKRVRGGDYQNGAIWPVWNNIALAVGQLYGILGSSDYRQHIGELLRKSNWAECIRVDGTPVRPDQLWNIAIQAQWEKVDEVLGRKKFPSILVQTDM